MMITRSRSTDMKPWAAFEHHIINFMIQKKNRYQVTTVFEAKGV